MKLARKDQEMAKKDLVMSTMATQTVNMQALLVANGLVPGPSSSNQAPERICACSQLTSNLAGKAYTSNTPSRKRHSSQQLGRASKDIRVVGVEDYNRFDVLTQAESYPDCSMKPASVISTSSRQVAVHNYAWGEQLDENLVTRPVNHDRPTQNVLCPT
jgi:hypothetical protein